MLYFYLTPPLKTLLAFDPVYPAVALLLQNNAAAPGTLTDSHFFKSSVTHITEGCISPTPGVNDINVNSFFKC